MPMSHKDAIADANERHWSKMVAEGCGLVCDRRRQAGSPRPLKQF